MLSALRLLICIAAYHFVHQVCLSLRNGCKPQRQAVDALHRHKILANTSKWIVSRSPTPSQAPTSGDPPVQTWTPDPDLQPGPEPEPEPMPVPTPTPTPMPTPFTPFTPMPMPTTAPIGTPLRGHSPAFPPMPDFFFTPATSCHLPDFIAQAETATPTPHRRMKVARELIVALESQLKEQRAKNGTLEEQIELQVKEERRKGDEALQKEKASKRQAEQRHEEALEKSQEEARTAASSLAKLKQHVSEWAEFLKASRSTRLRFRTWRARGRLAQFEVGPLPARRAFTSAWTQTEAVSTVAAPATPPATEPAAAPVIELAAAAPAAEPDAVSVVEPAAAPAADSAVAPVVVSAATPDAESPGAPDALPMAEPASTPAAMIAAPLDAVQADGIGARDWIIPKLRTNLGGSVQRVKMQEGRAAAARKEARTRKVRAQQARQARTVSESAVSLLTPKCRALEAQAQGNLAAVAGCIGMPPGADGNFRLDAVLEALRSLLSQQDRTSSVKDSEMPDWDCGSGDESFSGEGSDDEGLQDESFDDDDDASDRASWSGEEQEGDAGIMSEHEEDLMNLDAPAPGSSASQLPTPEDLLNFGMINISDTGANESGSFMTTDSTGDVPLHFAPTSLPDPNAMVGVSTDAGLVSTDAMDTTTSDAADSDVFMSDNPNAFVSYGDDMFPRVPLTIPTVVNHGILPDYVAPSQPRHDLPRMLSPPPGLAMHPFPLSGLTLGTAGPVMGIPPAPYNFPGSRVQVLRQANSTPTPAPRSTAPAMARSMVPVGPSPLGTPGPSRKPANQPGPATQPFIYPGIVGSLMSIAGWESATRKTSAPDSTSQSRASGSTIQASAGSSDSAVSSKRRKLPQTAAALTPAVSVGSGSGLFNLPPGLRTLVPGYSAPASASSLSAPAPRPPVSAPAVAPASAPGPSTSGNIGHTMMIPTAPPSSSSVGLQRQQQVQSNATAPASRPPTLGLSGHTMTFAMAPTSSSRVGVQRPQQPQNKPPAPGPG